MSTAKSQSFYYVKYVLNRSVSDDFFSKEFDDFLEEIGPDRPVYFSEHLIRTRFSCVEVVFNYTFAISFNRLCRKRGFADYFSADDLERYRNSEGQYSLDFGEVKND